MYMYECLHEVPTPSKTKPVQSIYTGGLWLFVYTSSAHIAPSLI